MNNRKLTARVSNAPYLASDDALRAIEAEYQAYENDLELQVATVKTTYPGYQHYNYQVDPIGHDPYVLAAIVSARAGSFKPNDPIVRDLMATLKRPRRQYTLTITPDGDTLNIRLLNYCLNCIIDSILNYDEICAYAAYLRSHGNRPELFPKTEYPHATELSKPRQYTVPNDIMAQYSLVRRVVEISKDLIGYPYVWAGSTVETSFDCSGFVSYILDQLGYRYRNYIDGKETRLPVAGSERGGVFYDGIYEKCQHIKVGDEQPGDLIFFSGTFDVSYRKARLSHTGVYLGNGWFIASSSTRGVQYANLSDQSSGERTWSDLLVCYGRLKGQPNEK